ncbi:O-antigen ligase family protein [Wandonia haliotis]
MTDKIKIHFGLLAFISLLLIYPIDGIKYVTSFFLPMPPFGMIGFIAASLLIPVFFAFKRPFRHTMMVLMYLLICLAMAFAMIQSNHFEIDDLWTFFNTFFIAPTIGYFTFFFLKNSQQTTSIHKTLSFVLLILALLIAVHYSFRGLFPQSNYLRIAEATMFTGLLLLAYTQSTTERFFTTFFIIILLFLAESRFSLFSFCILTGIYFFFLSKRLLFYMLSSISILIISILLISPDTLLQSRYYRLIFNTQNDTSLNKREELTEYGFQIIENKPILGEFAYHKDLCSGCYTHNVFSFWFEFGISGIIFAVSTSIFMIYTGIQLLRLSKKEKNNSNFLLVSMLIITYSLIGIMFSKHWNYTTFYIALGAAFYFAEYRKLKYK